VLWISILILIATIKDANHLTVHCADEERAEDVPIPAFVPGSLGDEEESSSRGGDVGLLEPPPGFAPTAIPFQFPMNIGGGDDDMGSGPAPDLLAGAAIGAGAGAAAPIPLTAHPNSPLTADGDEDPEDYPQIELTQEVFGSPQFANWKAAWATQLNISRSDAFAIFTGALLTNQEAIDITRNAPSLREGMHDDLSFRWHQYHGPIFEELGVDISPNISRPPGSAADAPMPQGPRPTAAPTPFAFSLPSEAGQTPLSVQQFRENDRKLDIDVNNFNWGAARGEGDMVHLSSHAESERHGSTRFECAPAHVDNFDPNTEQGLSDLRGSLLTTLAKESIDAYRIESTVIDSSPSAIWDLLMMAPHKCTVGDIGAKRLKLDARIAGSLAPHLLTPPVMAFLRACRNKVAEVIEMAIVYHPDDSAEWRKREADVGVETRWQESPDGLQAFLHTSHQPVIALLNTITALDPRQLFGDEPLTSIAPSRQGDSYVHAVLPLTLLSQATSRPYGPRMYGRRQRRRPRGQRPEHLSRPSCHLWPCPLRGP
jgi:hypothetical protein